MELATDEDRELFSQCGGVCFNYSIVPYEITKLKYIVSHIIVVASEWAVLLNGSEHIYNNRLDLVFIHMLGVHIPST